MTIESDVLTSLMDNSRDSNRVIATKLDYSPTTVSKKIKALEESRVIKKYTVSVDHSKLGYNIAAIINVTVRDKLKQMEEYISQQPGVVAVYDVTGEYDVVVIVKCRDTGDLSKLVKSLLEHSNIERTNTQVVLNVVKEDFNLPPIEIKTR
ncbi:MAG: Lrp/AsnC family transcriptional regulator [Candidatus Hodarchaeales archaeon]